MSWLKRWRWVVLLPVAAVIIGTFGFMGIEKLSFLDSLYLTIQTITTVGFGDIHPVTAGGKIFAIFIIVFGISTFLTILMNILEWLVRRQERGMHERRRDMLIGVFFTEMGRELLRIFIRFDPDVAGIRQDFTMTADWTGEDFRKLKNRLKKHAHAVHPAHLDLPALYNFLKDKGDLLMRQLENPEIIENENYAQLLWATVHLRDELAARPALVKLPETDIAHLMNDTKRAYSLLTLEWIEYMQYLKNRYPFLFSLALRTNPYVENPSPIVK